MAKGKKKSSRKSAQTRGRTYMTRAVSPQTAAVIGRMAGIIEEEGLTMFGLAKLTDYNHETVRRYMRGMTSPEIGFAVRFCKVFKVDPSWLLLGKGKARR